MLESEMPIKQPHPDVLNYIKEKYFCRHGSIFSYRTGNEVCFVPSTKNLKRYNHSYLQVGNKTYKRAHVVWYLTYDVWPTMDLLHKNGDRLDDRVENLEEGSATTRMSRRAGSRQYRGFSVYREKDNLTTPWRAKNYKYGVDLRYFETEEAAKARVDEFIEKGCQWWGL